MKEISYLDEREVGIYAFVISMSFCSLVEINLSELFLFGVSLISVMTSDKTNKQDYITNSFEGELCYEH